MAQPPSWTLDEFVTLVRHAHLTDIELIHVLRKHSSDAIAVVRQGIHSWHRGSRDTTLLSWRMKTWLENRNEPVECAVCHVRLDAEQLQS